MSSSILTLKAVVISSCNLKCASRRRPYCRASAAVSQSEQLHLHIQKLGQSLTPSVVVLESHFSPPTTRWDIHDCPRLATGFFLHPTLIATSVDAVARVAAATPYEAQIARTLAYSSRGAVMTTRPLAVSFARGIAVLEVVQRSDTGAPPPRVCALAESPPEKDSVLLAVSRHQSLGLALMVGNARGGAAADRSVGATAPWPLDDGSGWIEHGWFGVGNGGDAAPGSSSAVREVSVARIMGSPWFNLGGEVIGVSSWEVKDEDDEFLVGFAAPAASVRAVAEYVKTKGVNDPIVMDGWIDGHVIYECV